jgi:hypothetical protein
MTTRTWEDNARDFAALDEGEGWPFAVLVACSVEKGKGNGGDRHSAQFLARGTEATKPGEKVNAETFAKAAGTSGDRVLRYLDGWNNAAAKRVVPAASRLTPESVSTVALPTKPSQSWMMPSDDGNTRKYRYLDTKVRPTGGRPRDSKPEDAAAIIEKRGATAVVAALSPEQQVEVAKAVIEMPKARREIRDQFRQEDLERMRNLVAKAGGDADFGPDDGDQALVASSLNVDLVKIAERIKRLRDQVGEDNWPMFAEIIKGGLDQIRVAVDRLDVPDFIPES